MNRVRLALVALACLFSAPALAQPYAGFSVGQSDAEESVAADLIDTGEVDGKDTGFKIYGGYRFATNLGFEAAYVDLGEWKYSGVFNGNPVSRGVIETSGLNLSLVGFLPVGNAVSLFGKVGLYVWESDASDFTQGLGFFTDTADDTDVSFGLGADFHFGRNASLRGEWERFEVVDSDVDFVSVGFLYRF